MYIRVCDVCGKKFTEQESRYEIMNIKSIDFLECKEINNYIDLCKDCGKKSLETIFNDCCHD